MKKWLRKLIGVTFLMGLSCTALADPPPFSGIVVRGEAPAAWTWVDPQAGLRVIVGADMNEFCSGTINFDLISYQDKNLPSGRMLTNVSGFLQTTVWDFLDFDCALFTTIEPVASGFGNFRAVDNDLQVTGPNNTNTWTLMVHGQLEDPWGTRMILSAHITQQFGNDSGYKVNSQIVLH